jgi:hypothetical protein
VGDRWQEAAKLLKQAAGAENSSQQLADAGEIISEIADQEQKLWSCLEALAAR